jgi:hypothetical protein
MKQFLRKRWGDLALHEKRSEFMAGSKSRREFSDLSGQKKQLARNQLKKPTAANLYGDSRKVAFEPTKMVNIST